MPGAINTLLVLQGHQQETPGSPAFVPWDAYAPHARGYMLGGTPVFCVRLCSCRLFGTL